MTADIAAAAERYRAGDLTSAARVCRDIIAGDPAHFDALHLLGVVCTNLGRRADGVAWLLRAEAVRQDVPKLHANLGAAFSAVKRYDRAEVAFRRSLAGQPNDPGTWNNLGLALRGLNRDADAIDAFQSALRLAPTHDMAAFNLARVWTDTGQVQEAASLFEALAARLLPNGPAGRVAELMQAFARLRMEEGRPNDALAIIRQVRERRPDASPFLYNESLVLLLLGRYTEGWRAYEARWHAPGHDRPHPDYRVLDLDEVTGKRVLVTEEQGRGDIIQFMRFLRPLAARGARIRLSVYADLIPLAREIPDVEMVLGPDGDQAEYDVLTSIMSLPLAFGTTPETIPAEVPYLRPPAAHVARMRHHLGARRCPRVGIVWSGSRFSEARAAMPAAVLEPLLRRPNVDFHCLQKNIRPQDQSWLDQTRLVTTHQDMLRDFGDTAALIETMDLVISIDTAVAHLAGALAKPVWILLGFNPDWRWLTGRDDSPWYPTARLFRQNKPHDWPGVIAAVLEALAF